MNRFALFNQLMCIAWLALAVTSPARAQDTSMQQYEVELIVFRVVNPTGTPEDWSLEEARAKSSLPSIVDAEETAPSVPVPAAIAPANDSSIQPLEAGRFRMTAIEAALRRNRNYQPLAHVGWTQPGFAMDSPRPLAIENFLSDIGLTGTVTLTRGKYLHLTLDLTLASATEDKRYVLREHRRMRKSGEKHYLDHPQFGVIALVTPRN